MSNEPTNSYSYKPFAIGALIKHIVEQKRITRDQLAKSLKIDRRSIHRVFNLKHPNILHLLRLSEAVDENLLLNYHPNVKPIPNPLEVENVQLKTENALLKQQLADYNKITEESKLLKAQLDVLRDVMKGKM